MKWRDVKAVPFRVKCLVTRKFTWVDTETGEETTEKYRLRDAWQIIGVHSYNWWWVHRYGQMSCGCTKNPLTRRMVSYRWRCPTHMAWAAELEREQEEREREKE